MNLIAQGKQVIDILSDNESLLSGKLNRISIYYQENKLNIDLSISLMYSKKYSEIVIEFIGVSEYSLYYNSENNFYFIEEYKFFKNENFVYISLDPIHGLKDERDSNDNDYIISIDVKLKAISRE